MSFITSVCILLVAVTVVCGLCPAGWMSYHKHCYMYTTDKETWANARLMCKWHDSDLITIETAAEQAWFVTEALKFNHTFVDDGFWLGGTDWTVEGQWLWETTNMPINYITWGASQPNNRNNSENCLAAVKYFDYMWSDEACDWTHHIQYVCERPETQPATVG